MASTARRLPRKLPVWSAPLVPVALAMTVGIVLDRFGVVPISASLGVALVCILAWLIFINTSYRWLALFYLWAGVAGLAAGYHHWQRYHVDGDDISHFADYDGQPVRLRGTLASAPSTQAGKQGPLSFPTKTTTRFVLNATHRQELANLTWQNVNGLVQVTLIGRADDITVGDAVELLGRLTLPGEAMNPGEFDYAAFLRDQGVTATLTVLASDEVALVRRGWPTSPFGWLAVLRGRAQRTLNADLGGQSGVAAALLLGEGSGMSNDDWDQYQRTGIIHVLAISGQHLVVLAGFLWLASRVFRIRRRHAALVIALLLISYALLTGGRPPVMRAAWVVGVYCGGILLQRPVAHANAFALGWIGVAIMNPTDLFNAGCQLSFLAVAVLVWGVGHWADNQPVDPIERVVDKARSWHAMVGIQSMRTLLASYAINAVVWLAVSPLVVAYFHVVSPIALLLGPPMVVLTSAALLAGFAFLVLASWCWPLAMLFGWATQASLFGCELLVSFGQRLPFAYFFVADVPTWWLWVFYVPLLIAITTPFVWRHGRWALLAGSAWLILGVVLQLLPTRPGELRCTFVSVGHGGCTVIETPHGHVTVYDAGATTGPDVTRRYIAPFLWSRGIRRIDELILSHADLDHFNGVPQLAERFTIGKVISTPTFAERSLPGMQKTLASLEAQGHVIEIVHVAQRWQHDGVSFEVLHPPPVGPAGKENARSLVLHVHHVDWSMLLTGDLEEAGLQRVLSLPPPRIDVLMAPHHGSDKSNVPALATWAKPTLVVSSQTSPTSERKNVKMYEQAGAKYLSTWPHGAITIRPGDPEATVETYRTKVRLKPF